MVETRADKIAYQSVINADERLKEIDKLDFAIAAWADYDNGLTQGFKDGAAWADKTMLDMVCKWLRENTYRYVQTMYGADLAQMIDDIRRDLEE